jgi:hypothetical protein
MEDTPSRTTALSRAKGALHPKPETRLNPEIATRNPKRSEYGVLMLVTGRGFTCGGRVVRCGIEMCGVRVEGAQGACQANGCSVLGLRVRALLVAA